MSKHTKLSVVLLTYNRAGDGYLKQALESILAQTYRDFELLIMDNHSSDDTAQLVMNYKDSRVTYIRQPKNGNATTNYLSGLWFSRGKYVLLTHDDDIMAPQMLERQMEFLEANPDVLCVGANVSLINENGDTIQNRLYDIFEDRIFSEVDYIKTYLEEKLWIPTPTLLFNRQSHIDALSNMVRTKESNYDSSGDIWLLFLLNLKGKIGFISEPLLNYRQHTGQESRNVNQSSPMSTVARYLLQTHSGHQKLRSHLPTIWGSYVRFETQDILFRAMTNGDEEAILQQSQALNEAWRMAIPADQRAVDSVLPAELFARIYSQQSSISKKAAEQINRTPPTAGAQKAYRQWLCGLMAGKSIFGSKGDLGRVALFGSMFTAFILVGAARKADIEITCCLDSAPARIGQHVLGVPVMDLKALAKLKSSIDTIVVTSERDHEYALFQILRGILGEEQIHIVSWKTLAAEMVTNSFSEALSDTSYRREAEAPALQQQMCYLEKEVS